MKQFLVLFVFGLGSLVLAQEANIETYSGSKIVGKIEGKISVVTTDGKLMVNLADIKQINFGIHPPEDIDQKIQIALHNLKSNIHKERELAQNELLEFYRFSYFLLKQPHKDREFSKRAQNIIDIIDKEKELKYLPNQAHDVIFKSDGAIYNGVIQDKVIQIKTNDVQEKQVKLHLSKIRLIVFHEAQKVIKIEGIDSDKWIEVGMLVNGKFKIEASGEIDFEPGNEEPMTCNPNGFISKLRVDGFYEGTLIGKVGVNGDPFHIGSSIENTSAVYGSLYIKIHYPNYAKQLDANGCIPEGFYEVKIK